MAFDACVNVREQLWMFLADRSFPTASRSSPIQRTGPLLLLERPLLPDIQTWIVWLDNTSPYSQG